MSGATLPLRRVLILADESAEWVVAGLPQLDRIALTFREFVRHEQAGEPIHLCVLWDPKVPAGNRSLPPHSATVGCDITDAANEFLKNEAPFDLVLSTRLLLHRDCMTALRERGSRTPQSPPPADQGGAWSYYSNFWQTQFGTAKSSQKSGPWEYLLGPDEIPACERRFLKGSGKSQDGLVSRHVNRPLSRVVSRWLLKLPLTPSTWSVLIFALPIFAGLAFTHGTYASFISGCAIFQLYSILDGCDGEIARAKFLQSEFGRRLDSLLDLLGNIILALTLGIGLARQAIRTEGIGWTYLLEGVAAAALIVLSEGIVFIGRTRTVGNTVLQTKWNGALYQRHHEFLERSGILVLGESCAWWIVQLTKRDMAMLAFLIFALLGWPAGILHLLVLVAGVSSVLASNAFLRPTTAALPQEAR